ncbi:MAG: aldo/keto reductase [Alphaproteobacteria bacterium]|nr:aldo/keto reductase [Alphaproteobacteria bacterium]
MDKRQLGKTDLMISPLGLGTVKFGRNEGVKYPSAFEIPDEDFLAELLARAKALGINMLDTAPAYGQSEERLGRLLTGQREDWVIIGKAGEEFEDGESSHIFTPDHFERSLERSLKRLNTDYLDALLIHSNGHDMEILAQNDLIAKLRDFKDQGLVKAIGASTKTVEGGIMALELLDIVMASYNPAYTDEKPVLDYAAKHGGGLILKKALASGHVDRIDPSRFPRENGNLCTSEKQIPACAGNAVEYSLNFAFDHPGVDAIIVGTINPKHLEENVKAAQSALRLRNAHADF